MAKNDVFISYSRKDFNEVIAIKSLLEKRIPNLSIWFDMDGIESGEQFEKKIIEAIKDSECVLYALSKNSEESDWVQNELNFAHNKQKRIIPLLLKGVTPSDHFYFKFGLLDRIDSTNPVQLEKLVRDLNNLCKSRVKEHPQTSPDKNKEEIIHDGIMEEEKNTEFAHPVVGIWNLILSLIKEKCSGDRTTLSTSSIQKNMRLMLLSQKIVDIQDKVKSQDIAFESECPFFMAIDAVRSNDTDLEIAGKILSGKIKKHDKITFSNGMSLPVEVIKINGIRMSTCKFGDYISLHYRNNSYIDGLFSSVSFAVQSNAQIPRINWSALKNELNERYGLNLLKKELTAYCNSNIFELINFIKSRTH